MKNTAMIVVDYQNTFVPVAEGGTGELGVENAGTLAPYINQLTESVRQRGGLVINTRDSHPVGHVSLASSFEGKKPITEGFALGIHPTPENNPEYFLSEDEIQSWSDEHNGLVAENIMDINKLKAYIQTVKVQALWPDHAMGGEKSSELLSRYEAHESDYEVIKGSEKESDSYSGFGGIIETEKGAITLDQLLQSYNIQIVEIMGLASDYCVGATAEDALTNGYETHIHARGIAGVDPKSAEEVLKKLYNQSAKIIN